MRIVHVVQSLAIGGQERLIVDLSGELSARGHDVHVITFEPGGALRRGLGKIPSKTIQRPKRFAPEFVATMLQALRQLEPDVVHTHGRAPLIYAVPAARLAGVKRVVHTKHGSFLEESKAVTLEKVSGQLCSVYVPVSEDTAKVTREREGIVEPKLRVIHNGVPLDNFGPDTSIRARVRKELDLPEDATVVGSVGRLAKVKNYPLLMRALNPVLGPKLRLVLVGGGPEEQIIADAIAPEKREFVTMTGPRQDIPDLLRAFDIFSLSSTNEGIPVAVLEAMATALPIVSTAVGGVPGVVPGEAGMLVESQNAPALREALLELSTRAERRLEMGAFARKHVQRTFSLQAMTDAYEEAYRGA